MIERLLCCNKKRIPYLVLIFTFGILMAVVGGTVASYIGNETENRKVEKYELDALVARAKLSNQPYLASILLSVQGAMAEGTLSELINYTAAYSEHAIKEHPHQRIKIIHPQEYKRTRI